MALMNEYIKRRMSAKELEEELLGLIRSYNSIRDTYLIVYASTSGKPIADVALTMDDYYIIFDMLRGVQSKNLDFYIETLGGSGEAVEEIVEFIRSKFDKVSFVVSGQAKSAGTILVLSADEILMSNSGSVGPIDAQVRIGRTVVSAHDYMEWINEKREEASASDKMNPFDATMVAQISPGELKMVYYSLKFAEDLVVEWLTRYKFKHWDVTETRKVKVTDDLKKERATQIAAELANHAKWRMHGRSIKIVDLENIGLKIQKIDEDSTLADVVYRIQTVVRLLFESTSAYKIFATSDQKLFKHAVLRGPEVKMKPPTPDVAEVEVSCSKCGKSHKLFAKFVDDPQIDKDFLSKGVKPFPKDNKLKCDCGLEVDVGGIRNELETKVGRRVL